MRRCPLLILALWAATAAASPRVVVVKSSDLGAYAQLVAGLRAEARAEVEERILEGQGGEKGLRGALERPAALIVALGPQAANAARRIAPGTPLVFAMVPYYEKYNLEGPQVTGISLTSDFSAELSMMRRIFPQSLRIGLVHDPRFSGQVVEEVRRLGAERNQLIVPVAVDAAASVPRALKEARRKVDALMVVADKTVASAAVIKALIRYSVEEKLPLTALSTSQVKEGAMFALAPSPLGMGQQAGRLVNRILHEKVDPSALAVARPEVLELSLNVETLKKVGGAGSAAGVLEFAAENDYLMRVFR